MEKQYTPGPWQTNESNSFIYVKTIFGNDVVCQLTDSGHNKETSVCNSKIISAAPELLEALINVYEHLKMVSEWHKNLPTEYIDQVESAINKATN